MSQIILIVGLGNPGSRYANTRHNAGYWWIDELVSSFNATLRPESRFHGQHARVTSAGHDCHLLKPDTFMNESGRSVAALAKFYKIPVEAMLIVHDELDLPPGTVRLKQGGGHGGHNGLRDTIKCLGSPDFLRLRIGIGHPGHKDDVVDYVLRPAETDQKIAIDLAITDSQQIAPLLLQGEIQQAMTALHTKV